MCLHRRLLPLLFVVLGLALAGPSAASAHEHRTVAGDYELVVGFLNEPAYEGQLNGLDLRVTRLGSGEPLDGLDRTLKAEVTMGGDSLSLPLVPRAGHVHGQGAERGAYDGEFLPTRSGTFYFYLTGTVEGRPVAELFESGPGRFSDVEPTGAIQFPDRLPSGREFQRALAAADSRAATATTLAAVGIGVGLLGLLVAVGTLVWARRAVPPVPRPKDASASRPSPTTAREHL
jgi:hypothetical protein